MSHLWICRDVSWTDATGVQRADHYGRYPW
jgi:hypothetical protein